MEDTPKNKNSKMILSDIVTLKMNYNDGQI